MAVVLEAETDGRINAEDASGSWGPNEANGLLADGGRRHEPWVAS